MRWDEPIFSGTYNQWHWAVSRHTVPRLDKLVAKHFSGLRLCITAFDSGPIKPSTEELTIGWSLIGDVMVSPPLTLDLVIPSDTHDEWFLIGQLPDSFPELDRFVNYFGFNLADPREMAATFDPTWERSGLDWLYPLQERFWQQLEVLNPRAYIASGDTDVVASTDRVFVTRFIEAAASVGT